MTILKVLTLAFLVTLSSWSFAETVNINTADAQVIAKHVKGVGSARAQAIVEYREQNGEFANVSDLTKVRGIGDRILAMNADVLVVGEME